MAALGKIVAKMKGHQGIRSINSGENVDSLLKIFRAISMRDQGLHEKTLRETTFAVEVSIDPITENEMLDGLN